LPERGEDTDVTAVAVFAHVVRRVGIFLGVITELLGTIYVLAFRQSRPERRDIVPLVLVAMGAVIGFPPRPPSRFSTSRRRIRSQRSHVRFVSGATLAAREAIGGTSLSVIPPLFRRSGLGYPPGSPAIE
jgi:hypothetical protein